MLIFGILKQVVIYYLKFQQSRLSDNPSPGCPLTENEWAWAEKHYQEPHSISVHETKTQKQSRLTHGRLGKLRHIYLREYCPDNTKTNGEFKSHGAFVTHKSNQNITMCCSVTSGGDEEGNGWDSVG